MRRPRVARPDRNGYRPMLAAAHRWSDRVWAVDGCNGTGRHLAQRAVADGERVVDVPATLSGRTRVFSTGHGGKTDARSIGVAAVRTPSLAQVAVDDELAALRLLVRPSRRARRRPAPAPCPAAPAAARFESL